MEKKETYYAILYERLIFDERTIHTEIDYSTILNNIFSDEISAKIYAESLCVNRDKIRIFNKQIIYLVGNTCTAKFYDRYTIFEIHK